MERPYRIRTTYLEHYLQAVVRCGKAPVPIVTRSRYSDNNRATEASTVNDFLKGTNLYLIGMMGAGKTTVGRLLAAQLNYRFLDTDAIIEQVAGQSIRELFAQSGEAAFRQLESQVLGELCAYTRSAIATGGGIVLKRENWGYLRHGIVVWLDVPVEQLQARLEADTTRPLLQDVDPAIRLQSLLEQRQPLYAQADVRVHYTVAEPPEQVTTRAIEQIKQAIKPSV